MLHRFALTVVLAVGVATGARAQDAAAPATRWTITHVPVAQAVAGRPLILEFKVSPVEDVSYAIVYSRIAGEDKYKPTVVRGAGGLFRAELPADRLVAPSLAYYIKVVDTQGASHNVFASPRAAQLVEVAAPSAPAPPSPESEFTFEIGGTSDGAGLSSELDLSGLNALQAEFELLQAEDVVVSASKHSQSILESPAAIYVISREDLDAYAFRDVADALRFVPGVQVYRVNETTPLVGARGFADESNNLVLMLEQGRETNIELFGAPIIAAESWTLDDVERIEVIRGPGSALYGANAFSGVIQMFPRRGSSYREGYRLYLDQDTIIGGRMAQVRASGVTGTVDYTASAHYREDASASDESQRAFRKAAGQSRVSFDAGPLPIELNVGFSGIRGELFSILGETTADAVATHGYARTRAGPVQVAAYWSHWDALLGIADPQIASILPQVDFNTDTVNGDLLADFEFGGIDRLSAGLTVRWNRFESPQMTDPVSSETRVGVFVQNELHPIDWLLVSAGLRSDYSTLYLPSAATGDRLTISPRGAVIVPITDNHALRAGAGRAFRKPSFFEQNMRFDAFVPLDLNFANPELRNEEITGIDFGYTGRAGDVRWAVDGFYNQYRNFIEFDSGSVLFSNIGRDSDSYGGELSLRWRPRVDVGTFANYSFLEVTTIRPDPLAGADAVERSDDTSDPTHMLNLGIRYTPMFGLRVACAMHWQSERTWRILNPDKGGLLLGGNELQRIPAYASVFARLGWSFGQWELGVIGEQAQADRHAEFPGLDEISPPDRLSPPPAGARYGGERLPPRAVAYVEGRF